MTSLPDGAASIFAVATRISTLDSSGFVDPGANTFATTTAVKATCTPVLETGDDLSYKNAAGDLGAWAKHGDMKKYYTVSLELVTPDPALEAACVGGIVYTDSSVALGAPSGLTVTPQTTSGTLVAGTYGYRATFFNAYGETIAETDVSAVTTGSTSTIILNVGTIPAGAIGVRFYGRTIGAEQLLGSFQNIGVQATSAASGTGMVTSLAVTALTKGIPVGTTFQISGDTNTTKITFTTTAFAPAGTVVLPVSTSPASITTTIAAGNIVPVFVDTGAITPSGYVPTVDTTAGPGQVGYQEPALGIVGNPNGVSLEFWTKAIIRGSQTPLLPYYRWVLPKVQNMHTMPKDLTNANTQTIMEGQGFENPNWGSGPFGDWQFDSSKVFQRARCGAQVLPVASNAPVAVAANV